MARSSIKLLEHKLQFVVKKFLHEKLSDVGEDVTIMVSLCDNLFFVNV